MTMTETPTLDPFRLPRAAIPTRYDVELVPDLSAATFEGRVRIAVELAEPVEELVLNAIELEIIEVTVDGSDAGWRLEEETERLFVVPLGGLQPGLLTVVIAFTGVLNDKLRGFYRSTFRDEAGAAHVIATTQMQATDCRRAFPCWDEPDFKAVFGITLVIDPTLLAVSNGPEIERQDRPAGPSGPRVAVRFADTMVMSTYLVAFVVGPLEATAPVDVGGIPLRIVHV
ncbi:MAG: M1 family peptidase, partial [Acidimicrobiia bacterium]|nr:M1 family peptidase [Acidimicrobiia bacterium]